VNLPAHLVIICGTKYYRTGGYEDLDSISIMQMIGRAGRPQFDTSAVAVVMTDRRGESKYKTMVDGQELIESSLHQSLTEHLNSEIVLKTISNTEDAIAWIKSTFLFVRISKNPSAYTINGISSNYVDVEKWIRDVFEDMLQHGLIVRQSNGEVFSTKLGKTLCHHRTNFGTMKLFTQMDSNSDFYETLRTLAKSEEFQHIVLRRNEKRILNEFNKNSDAVRFSVGKLVRDSTDKICVLFQAFLSNQKIDDWGLRSEVTQVLSLSSRIMRCMIECLIERKAALALLNALKLSQCVESHLWFDSDHVCRQLDKIGSTLSSHLVSGNIKSFSELEQCNPRRIEALIKRNPPAGNAVLENLFRIWPKLSIQSRLTEANGHMELHLSISSLNFESRPDRHKYLGSLLLKFWNCNISYM
jgi:ATP-dependent DNA helicase HFM1/MER3